jgi:hypothetical protein
VTVDFVYKQRAEAGKKWALRNAKLRMSRKLVFASGLLRCFFCHLDPNAAAAREALRQHDMTKLLVYMERELAQTPLELLARAVSRPATENTTGRKLFNSYDRFLSVLDDQDKRRELEEMTESEMGISPVWQEIRELSRDFHDGLLELFSGKDAELSKLTTYYGVF